jgi:hypothetical protein
LGYRRARLAGLAGGATFGFKFGNFPDLVAASIFPSAAFSGSRRGARGNLSVSMVRRTAAVTAVSSSSEGNCRQDPKTALIPGPITHRTLAVSVNNATTPLSHRAPTNSGIVGARCLFAPTDRRVSPYLYAAMAVSGFQVIGS